MRQVILDIETKKTFDEVAGYFPEKLEVSFVGVCVRENWNTPGELVGYFENELPALFELLETADVVVGFNLDQFDMPALAPYYSGDIAKVPTLDIMGKIKDSCGHRISLDAVASETLGIGKTGDGLDAIKYYKMGNLVALKEYCLQDVKLTRDVYDFGLSKGKVMFLNKWNRHIECPVDFSFTPKKDAGVQMSLL